MTDSGFDQRQSELGWAAWLITLVGSSSLTGLLAQLAEGPEKAGLSSVATFFMAAVGGLALTVGTAGAWVFVERGELQGYALLIAVTVCFAAGIAVSNLIGIAVVGYDTVNQTLMNTPDNPGGTLFALLAACLVTYGPVASAQAAIAGGLLGHWFTLIAGKDTL